MIDSSIGKELVDLFGEGAAFHDIERRLYSIDAGTLPAIFSSGLRTVPFAIVRPINKEQLVSLMEIARKHHIYLVPRGAGTAGYGGAVPTKESIVVDLHLMRSVLAIDQGKCEVCVEPGITVQDLDRYLADHGLTLRSYPSSAISATLGGWLAAGMGTGIGSYQFGYLQDAVTEIKLVTPQGLYILRGKDVVLAAGLSGTTGFISRITLRVRKPAREDKLAIYFTSFDVFVDYVRKAEEIADEIWHVGYSNVCQEMRSRQAIGQQLKRDKLHRDRMDIPEMPDYGAGLLGLFVGSPNAITHLKELAAGDGAELLSSPVADYLWKERFYPMRQKALGPSIIPGEVTLPLKQLPELIRRIDRKYPKRYAVEGTLVNRGKETTALFIFLDDERRPFYGLSYIKSIYILSQARKLSGQAYAAGMMLNSESMDLWGKEGLERIYRFKQRIDPDNLMNPGKIFPSSMDKTSPTAYLEFLTRLAGKFPSLLANADSLLQKIARPQAPAYTTPTGKISDPNMRWDAFSCTGCGYCRTVCSEFNVFEWESTSPRGKFAYLKQNRHKLDERMADALFMCATCRHCDTVCQARIPILQDWDLNIRPSLREAGYNLPLFHQGATRNVLTEHNPSGHPHVKRSDFLTPDIRYSEEGTLGYWAGCTASYSMQQLALNPLRILNAAGIEPVLFKEDEWCCGSDILLYGQMDEIASTIKHNIEAIQRRGVKKLIVHCPGCWAAFSLYYPLMAKNLGLAWDVQVEHVTLTMADCISAGKIEFKHPVPMKVTYHDPCHIGRRGNIYEPPREVLQAIPGVELVEMPHNRENSPCCGRQLFQYTAHGPKPYVDRVREGHQAGASALVTCCPGCQVTYILGVREAGIEQFECLDISDLVCRGLGIPGIPDKIISRMVRQGYDTTIAPIVETDSARSSNLFAPHQTGYNALPGKKQE